MTNPSNDSTAPRVRDVICAVIALLVALPLIGLALVTVWIEDRRNPFYAADRVGLNGKPFRMLKIRSMIPGAEDNGRITVAADDPRITRVGRVIRRLKIDELLQLWNVLVGEMSLVGPRPCLPQDVEVFTTEEHKLLEVRPGLTDLATIVFANEAEQVRGAANPDLLYEQCIRPWKSRLSLLYATNVDRHRLDFLILRATAVGMVSQHRAVRHAAELAHALGASPELVRICETTSALPPAPPPGADTIVNIPRAARPANAAAVSLNNEGGRLSRRESFLPFHIPAIGDEEVNAVSETLRSGWLTTGQTTRSFETAFAEYLGVPHALAVNSCTAALHLALEAVGVGPGDEVLVPTMTFAASAEVVTYLGARPVLVDCEPDTLNISVADAARKLSSRTRAIIPVHFAGQACDVLAIRELARDHRLFVIDDAAHAFPTQSILGPIGTVADITCFSFYATKTITTGEGGMVTTANPEWAERMRIMSLHGISRNAWNRYDKGGDWKYEILAPGFKYNLTDMASSLGLAQLRRSRQLHSRRVKIALEYTKAFSTSDLIQPLDVSDPSGHAWHLYVIKLALEKLRIDRDIFIRELKGRNIGASVHFIPLHTHPYYRDMYKYSQSDMPAAMEAFSRIISLPISPAMTDTDVRDVVSAVNGIAENARR